LPLWTFTLPWLWRSGRPLPEAVDLPPDILAAVDGQRVNAPVLADAVKLLGDLHGQLSRGSDHDALDLTRARVYLLGHRYAESGCLSGPGLGLADDVPALKLRAVWPAPVWAWPLRTPCSPAPLASHYSMITLEMWSYPNFSVALMRLYRASTGLNRQRSSGHGP